MIGYYICIGLVLFTIIIAGAAQARVNSAYSAHKKTPSSLNMTGRDLVYAMSRHSHIALKIKSSKGQLSDHYDPRDKSINISEENMNSNSVSALAVVAHEFGHALQDEESYAPYKIRQISVKVSNFMSAMLVPMLLIGILLEMFWLVGVGEIFIYCVVGVYFLSFVVSLITIPVEYNASSRAKKLLVEMGANGEGEMRATSEVLNAAAMTYVASMLVNLVYLLRWIYILGIFRRD